MEEIKETLMDIVDIYSERWNYLKQYIPDLDYNKINTDYRDLNNIVGHQQRAFAIYWAIKEYERTGGIGLEPGCGQAISPYCIGTDFYSGSNHPQYGGAYWPHVRCLGEMLPFKNESFGFIISHHSLNCMARHAFKEWLRVLKRGGRMVIVIPDKKYDPENSSYITYYSAEEFKNILGQILDVKIIEYDTLHNNFSFNIVIEKL